jgi:hypothetical protein
VRVHREEGVASHLGPEPCGGTREGDGEASAGEGTGQPLSRERSSVPGADAFQIAEGNTMGAPARAPGRPGVVGDPGMCRRSLYGNREVSCPASDNPLLVRSGKVRSRSR